MPGIPPKGRKTRLATAERAAEGQSEAAVPGIWNNKLAHVHTPLSLTHFLIASGTIVIVLYYVK
jgi:hypothetical protein